VTAPLAAERVVALVREALALVRVGTRANAKDESMPDFVHLVCLEVSLTDAEYQASQWLEREHAERNRP
jgi:hypothetical protein